MFIRWWAAVAAMCFAFLLPGCGGGGGGEDSQSVTVELSQESIEIEAEEEAGGSATLTATIKGSYDGTVYIGATASGTEIETVAVEFDQTRAVITVTAGTWLTEGQYTGTLQVMACSDQACQQHIGGSPFTLPYTVNVRAAMKVTPQEVAVASVSGDATDLQSVTVQLPVSQSDYTVAAPDDWMEIVDKTESGFKIRMLPAPAGTYQASIEVTSAMHRRSIWVSHEVAAPPGGEHDLVVGSGDVSIAAFEGGQASVLLSAQAPTWNAPITTSVQYVDGRDWLTVSPAGGGLTLTVDARDLVQGTYQAWLQIAAGPYAIGKTVGVAVTVGAGLVQPADRVVDVVGTTTEAQLSGSAMIEATSGLPLNWVATSDAAWLKMDTAAGRSENALSYHVDTALLADLANGQTHMATVTVTTDTTGVTATSFHVALQKNLPEVRYVAPHAQPAGRENTLIVRGIGFMSIADRKFEIEGIDMAGVNVVNDKEIQVQIPASATAGSHVIRIGNNLGFTTPQSSFTLYEPTAFGYARLPQSGFKRGLVFDPVNRVLFSVNEDQDAVLRYGFDGAQWTRSVKALPSLGAVGLTPDASSLLAVSANGVLRRLNPATLATLSTHTYGNAFMSGPSDGPGVAVTNDGRAWLAAGDYWGTPVTFDLWTQTFTPVPIDDNLPTSFYFGPWWNVSRNGERLIMNQAWGISPAPLMLYLDSWDSVLHENPAGLNASARISQSDDGQRLMLDETTVYDAGFSLIGSVRLPESGYSVVASTLSPDGRRAYALAYLDGYRHDATAKPRVYVFDSSQVPSGSSALPVAGQFDLADHASCVDNEWDCPSNATMTIAPDGKTLFVAGHDALLVVPVPVGMQSASSIGNRKRATRAAAKPAASGILAWPR